MLRETDLAANDAARLDAIETALSEEQTSGGLPPEVRAQAAIRAELVPGLAAIMQSWAKLPPAIQDQVGVQAVALAFYGWLGGDGCSEPANRWLTDEAVGRCDARADRALGLINDIVGASMPELYGTGKQDPAWAQGAGPAAPLDMIWEAALPSPVQFATALHRRTWQTLQARAAFLDAAGKAEEHRNVSWPAEDAEDEALTDLLMLSCRDRADAKALLQHLIWYLGVRPQHPRRPLSQGDATLLALRLQGLGLILGQEVPGAVAAPQAGVMTGLIEVHRAAWLAFKAAPSRAEKASDITE